MGKLIYAMGGVSADGYIVGPDGRFDFRKPGRDRTMFGSQAQRDL